MTDISSCVIAKCLNNGIHFRPYYTNCNETADAFFCKTGILSNDKGYKKSLKIQKRGNQTP